jgi:hypothetical protein
MIFQPQIICLFLWILKVNCQDIEVQGCAFYKRLYSDAGRFTEQIYVLNLRARHSIVCVAYNLSRNISHTEQSSFVQIWL